MSGCCAGHCDAGDGGPRYRRILQIAFAINITMFLVEVAGGMLAHSSALQADSLDFLSDAANYGISLFVFGMALQVRSKAALIKGACMAAMGLWVLGSTAWQAWHGTLPAAEMMGGVALVALVANGAVAGLLFAYRAGDANMRSVWICTRNDVINNLAVMLAATGVFTTGANWPDIAVAVIIGALNLSGAGHVITRARAEIRGAAAAIAA